MACLTADFVSNRKLKIPWCLDLGFAYRQWGVLPKGGGLLDNEQYILDMMSLALRVFDAYSRPMESQTNDDIKLISWVERE